MSQFSGTIVVACVVTSLMAPGLSAQNLVVNPEFDTDISGWSGLGWWDPLDVNGSGSSGSGTWINNWSAGGSLYLLQCVEIDTFFEGYDLSGYVFIPSGQAGEGYSYISVAFFSDVACNDVIDGYSTSTFTGFDVWEPLTLTDWTPTGAASAQIGVANIISVEGDFQTYHDSVFFGPNPFMIFADGFESIDVSQWDGAEGYPWEGAYDACTSSCTGTGPMDCLAIAGVTGAQPFCSPQCSGPGGSCPGRTGFAGTCALGSPTPDHCAILCDVGLQDCPAGMTCFSVTGGALCLWPE